MDSQTLAPEVLADIEWVFGYGSLMWKPGFEYEETRPARLEGFHRDFCIYSHHYRGTPERPGLVLGLDAGGVCQGLAFRFAPARRTEVIDYLNERELVGYAYTPKVVDIDTGSEILRAYTFVADNSHRQYAGQLPLDKSAQLIMNAQGLSGLNRDYLINTVKQLEHMGFKDDSLHTLLKHIEYLTGVIDMGGGI